MTDVTQNDQIEGMLKVLEGNEMGAMMTLMYRDFFTSMQKEKKYDAERSAKFQEFVIAALTKIMITLKIPQSEIDALLQKIN